MQHPSMVAINILLVEDEPLIRMVTAETLQDEGFSVAEAVNATEAIGIMRDGAIRLAAAIIDLGLPDRPGDVLAKEIRSLQADFPILIASGRDRSEVSRLFKDDPHVRFVGKPYTGAELVKALASLGVTPASL
jgi:CheY-like chemotaxis protein